MYNYDPETQFYCKKVNDNKINNYIDRLLKLIAQNLHGIGGSALLTPPSHRGARKLEAAFYFLIQ